jgi:hypothetical protein
MVPTEEIVSYMLIKHEELISFFVSDISVVENLNSQEESKLLDAALEEILEDVRVLVYSSIAGAFGGFFGQPFNRAVGAVEYRMGRKN